MISCEGSEKWRMHTDLAKVALCAAGTGGGQGTDQGSAPPGNGGSDPGAPPAGERPQALGLAGLLTHAHSSLQGGCSQLSNSLAHQE